MPRKKKYHKTQAKKQAPVQQQPSQADVKKATIKNLVFGTISIVVLFLIFHFFF
ncbi:hypothetical protein [Ligilactobacillus ceti]|uniref:Uncharacterized protein n=1 Tax=Ligilactobacillus ceti DSM 22408 TaxID=1122146 RepID=A0A0R2KMX3_9LACO|nr:hypothetical protein [Ligilactobacillus ceti]KRN88821.1 hypothetical protein IV53_GL000791 [Ligilactobacillus ceti DSM 22408]